MSIFEEMYLIWRRVIQIARTPKTALRTLALIVKSSGIPGLISAAKFVIATAGSAKASRSGRYDFPIWFENWSESYREPDLSSGPLISIIMPVYNPPLEHLKSAVESVLEQTYTRWELCIADDKSNNPEVLSYLRHLESAESRIKVVFREENGHISAASNSAIEIAVGDFIAFLDHDDILMPWALKEIAHAVNSHPQAEFLYSDEMTIDANGRPLGSHFKSDLNRELARSINYFCHLSTYSARLLRDLDGLRVGFEGAQDYDLALRALENLADDEVVHIPVILYGWRAISGSTASDFRAKPYANLAGLRALEEHLGRNGLRGFVTENSVIPGTYRTHYELDSEPEVAIVIPTRNHAALLRACIESIALHTNYSNYKVVIVDNGSDERESKLYLAELKTQGVEVLEFGEPFNYSRINNFAVANISSEYLCLLNNDVEVTNSEWLRELLSVASHTEVGAVGAKLWYPDRTIQHAGVILGIGAVAGHQFRGFPDFNSGYAARASVAQELSAVTAACLVVKRTKYLEVGGLTEALAIGYNDVDFCLKLREAGYRNIYWPYAELIHHESKSRGWDTTPEKIVRAAEETQYMEQRWHLRQNKDPFYNPNLTCDFEDYSFNWDFNNVE